MAEKPIIFAMANPDPEITPEEVAEDAADDAIMATGRSDYPNQINNVLGFPYIFRGALDVRASTINMEMKIAAAEALAAPRPRGRARRGRARAYAGQPTALSAQGYIIPAPFDPRPDRLRADGRRRSGGHGERRGASRPFDDIEAYEQELFGTPRSDRGQSCKTIFEKVRHRGPKRVVFAEGEEEASIRAALAYHHGRLRRHPCSSVARTVIHKAMKTIGIDDG